MEQGQLTNQNLSQGDLTEEELVLLNNLMYIQDADNDIKSDITNFKGYKLSDFVGKYSDDECEEINKLPEEITDTTHEEYKAMIKKIEQDDKLMNLKITDTLADGKGGNAVCLEDPDNPDKATAVFRGTGSYEWIDDGIGGYSIMTEQQKKAVDWINRLPYKQITSTGHSKGGNKSMIVAILCPNVVRCVALDGQGVSPEFYEEYRDEINENKDKITLICSQDDYVNGLFTSIAGNTFYTKSDESYADRLLSVPLLKVIGQCLVKLAGIDINTPEKDEFIQSAIKLGREHCPATLLKFEDGKVSFREISEEKDPIARLLHEYVVYVNDNATLEDREYLFLVTMNMLQGEEGKIDVKCPDGFFGRMLKISGEWIESLNLTEEQKEKFKEFLEILKENKFCFTEDEIIEFNNFLSNIHGQEERISGGLIRDFSEATKEKLINDVKDVEGDNPLYFKRWAQWNELEGEVRAMIDADICHTAIDKYYNNLIDKNDESIKKINELFEKIYKKDIEYYDKLEQICDKIEDVQKNIINITQKFNTGKVSVNLPN